MLKILLNKDVECPLCKTKLVKDTMHVMSKHSEDVEYIYIKCKHKLSDDENCKGFIELLERDHQVFL